MICCRNSSLKSKSAFLIGLLALFFVMSSSYNRAMAESPTPAPVSKEEVEAISSHLRKCADGPQREPYASCKTVSPKKFETESQELEERFHRACTGGRNLKLICKSIALEGFNAALSTTIGAASLYCAKLYLQDSSGSSAAQDTAAVITAGATVTMAASRIEASVRSIIDKVKTCKITPKEGLARLFDAIINETKEKTNSLPDDLKRKIKAIDTEIISTLSGETLDTTKMMRLFQSRLIYSRLPTQIKDIAQYGRNGNEKKEKELDDKVELLISKRPQDQRERMKVFLTQIRDLSIAKTGEHLQTLFWGPPGTGKTTFAEDLGRELGIHVCVIKAAHFKDVSQLLGTETPGSDKISPLLECMLNSEFQPIVVVLDEFGAFLTSKKPPGYCGYDPDLEAMKALLGKENQSVRLRWPMIDLPTHRLVFVVTGNVDKDKIDPALIERMPPFHFEKLDEPELVNALETAFKTGIEFLETDAGLKKEDVRNIETIATIYKKYILEESMKMFKGARVLKEHVIPKFLIHVRLAYFAKRKRFDLNEFISENDKGFKNFIHNEFESQVTKPKQDLEESK